MTQIGDASPSGTPRERPAGELLKQLTEQVSVLVRDEIKLAQLELARKGKKAGRGAGLLGGSGLVALYGLACLIAAGVAGLSLVLPVWAAALIAGGALLAVAGVTGLAGRGSLRQATPPVPEEAVEDVKTDVQVIRESARR
jgi:Flp pilus assembly protein TadB